MKLTIKRSELLKLLTYASQAIPSRSAENQYLNYLIDVNEEGVSIIASDGSISTKVSQGLKDEKGNDVILSLENGTIQTPAKMLLDIISKLGGEIVTLDMVDTGLMNISDDYSTFNLVTKDGNEYPNVNLVIPEGKIGFTVPLKDLKTLFDTTSYAVSTKGNELYTGINVKALMGKLSFIATDGFRLASLTLPEPTQEANFTFTCPVKSLDMATKISETGECTIYLDEQRALFASSNVMISTRLLHGDFLSTTNLIPPSYPYTFKILTSDFLSSADRVKIISSADNSRNSQVKLTLSKDGGATLSAKSSNYGNSEEKLRVASLNMEEGTEVFEIYFNVDYAIDAVKALRSDEITFALNGPTRSVFVKNDNPDNIQLFQPITAN